MLDLLFVCRFVFLFQIITTFSVVDNMKEQFFAQQGKISRFHIVANFTCFVFRFMIFLGVWNFPSNWIIWPLVDTGKKIQRSRSFLMTLRS